MYGFIDRQNLPGLFRTFDFASPDTHAPQRYATTVPQQALFLMNSPFVVEQAKALAARPEVAGVRSRELRGRRACTGCCTAGRRRTDEVALGVRFVAEASRVGRDEADGVGAVRPGAAAGERVRVRGLTAGGTIGQEVIMATAADAECRHADVGADSPLENGDHIDQTTFHSRTRRCPNGRGGTHRREVVLMASPLPKHGRRHGVTSWLTTTMSVTPGIDRFDNTTVVLGDGQ